MSRHRKIRLSRSKAIVIAAAGALSVATAASAAAATTSQGSRGHAAGSDGPTGVTREAAGAPRLSVTDQLARPVAGAENQQGHDTLVQHAFRLRLTQARAAIAQWFANYQKAKPNTKGVTEGPRTVDTNNRSSYPAVEVTY